MSEQPSDPNATDTGQTRLNPSKEARIQWALDHDDFSGLTTEELTEALKRRAENLYNEGRKAEEERQDAEAKAKGRKGNNPAYAPMPSDTAEGQEKAHQAGLKAAGITTTETTGTNSGLSGTDSRLSPEARATAGLWAQQQGVAIGAEQMESEVLRRYGGRAEPQVPQLAPNARMFLSHRPPVKAYLSQYEGEYASHLQDDEFRKWIRDRGVLLYDMDPDDPEFLTKGKSLWDLAGAMVAADPTLKNTLKPEDWLDKMYLQAGGDAARKKKEEERKNAAAAAGPPPIVTTRETQTYTITAAQAQAFVDDLSGQLLGRLASDAELKRARSSMQKLLTPTVTTSTRDSTDPANVRVSTHTKAGVGPDEAGKILEMRMRRGSEGQAVSAGSLFEAALARMG